MDRNLFRRVETAFPVLNPELKARLIADLDACLEDNTHAWELQADGSYRLLRPGADDTAASAQDVLLAQLAEQA